MHTRIIMALLLGLAILMAAGCEDRTSAPLGYGEIAEENGEIYVDPYLETLTQSRLAYVMSRTLNPDGCLVEVDLPLMEPQGSPVTVTPYEKFPEFTVTITIPDGVPYQGMFYIEVPCWEEGDPSPEFGFVNVYNRTLDDIPLRTPGTVTTSTYWPWMKPTSSMYKFHPKLLPGRIYAFFEFEHLEYDAPGAASTFTVVASGPNKPQPYRDETIVYDEGEGD